MKHSESLAKFAPAFVAAQAEIENAHKNATNPHFRSKYADLTEIIDAIRPTLAKHGLGIIQIPGFEDGVLTMDNMILHTSGEWISGVSGSPIAKQDPQGVGSAITYMRRYSLAAMCGITQEDDDGNAASRNGTEPEARSETKVAQKKIEKIATRQERETLERYVAEFVGLDLSKEDNKKIATAAKLAEDATALSEYVQHGIGLLRGLLNKHKPLPPIEAEERDQRLELGEMANA